MFSPLLERDNGKCVLFWCEMKIDFNTVSEALSFYDNFEALCLIDKRIKPGKKISLTCGKHIVREISPEECSFAFRSALERVAS